MRRAVITGIGAVSPNGIGRERFWEATRNGVSGVRRITRFAPSAYQVQVAGEVPDEFDEKKYVEIKDRPHVSRAVDAATVAERAAAHDAAQIVVGASYDEDGQLNMAGRSAARSAKGRARSPPRRASRTSRWACFPAPGEVVSASAERRGDWAGVKSPSVLENLATGILTHLRQFEKLVP